MRNLFYLVLVANLLICSAANAFIQSEQFSEFSLNDIEADQQGFMQNTSGDGFIVLNGIELNRSQMCGLALTMEFKQAPFRATIFDIYWRTANVGFSESQKSFFIVNQEDTSSRNSYLIPLCKLYNFSGNLNQPQNQANITALRIDYPSNKNLSIRFDQLRFLDTLTMNALLEDENNIVLEPYERIAGPAFTSFDVIIPKLIFAFDEGLKRFTKDLPFLFFWISVIALLKGLMLWSYVRQFRRDK